MNEPVSPGSTIAFIGLGRMGRPMAERLANAGFLVQGYDVAEAAVDALRCVQGVRPAPSPEAAATGARAVVLMLPDSRVVHDVVLNQGVLAAMGSGCVLIDMSSSDPCRTRALADVVLSAGVPLVDAPVSGGVAGAANGSLTIMVGGAEQDITVVRPVLSALGERIFNCGPTGSGDSVKSLNNLLSAVHLLHVSEVMETARRSGLDLDVVLDVFNVSSGRSGSTQTKWPNFILSETYGSGFGFDLMLKDMKIALGLASSVGAPSALSRRAVELWDEAADFLEAEADHTEIARWVRSAGEHDEVAEQRGV